MSFSRHKPIRDPSSRHRLRCNICGPSRRQFLATAAGLGAGAILAAPAVQGQTSAPRLIDVHHHIVPPFWFEEVKDRIAAQGGGRIIPTWYGWSPQKAVEAMDRNGVDTAIISMTTPGIFFGDVPQGRRLSRAFNDYAMQIVKDHPGRFGLFATLPVPDTDGSLKEIEYAFEVLKVDGIGLMTSYGDKWLGDPAFAPVLAELNRRKAVVYVHPSSPLCCTSLMSYVPPFFSEFQQDTTRTILSLIFSGSLGRMPDIRFIFSHAGGTLPMVAGRIEHYSSLPAFKDKVPNGFDYELKRLYYEIANAAYRPSIAAITSMVPTSQIMFGSDFPLVAIDDTANGLRNLGLPAADVQAIARGNAIGLFPRLKG
ncbi:MAG TPA: amidohydrolase family protein [Xanthobacteraceae bacterium]|nr:amidohydrolase family protein [Xanthobacteraceae bacterium]